MIDLRGLSSLAVLSEGLVGVRSSVLRGGEPARVAGDPGAIGRLAAGHRASAARVTAAGMLGRDRVAQLVGGSWHGQASASFGRYWSELDGRLAALAGAHGQMAKALDQIADGSMRLNREAVSIAEGTAEWLGWAGIAVSGVDVAAAGRLLGEGMALVERWERLLRELEMFAEGIGPQLRVRLDFTRQPVVIRPLSPEPQAPIDVAPGAEGSGMGRKDRLRPGFPSRPPRERWIPRPLGPGFPRGPATRPPRSPRRPPPEAAPVSPGVGTPPVRGRFPRPKPGPKVGKTPVHLPTVGQPPPVPPAVQHPWLAPAPSPVDVYLFQTVSVGILLGRKVLRVVRRLRGGTGGRAAGRGKVPRASKPGTR